MDVKGIHVLDCLTKILENDMKDSKNEAIFA